MCFLKFKSYLSFLKIIFNWIVITHNNEKFKKNNLRLTYINERYSAKNEYGQENPLYWVI